MNEWAQANGVPVVRFRPGERKADVMAPDSARIETALSADAAATLAGMAINVCHVDTGQRTPQHAASQIARALAASCASLPSRG